MPSVNDESLSEAVSVLGESPVDSAELQALVQAVEVFHEDTIGYLDFINTGLILSLVLCSLILGVFVARFFFERLR